MYIECSLHIYIEHRNPETGKTLTTSLFRYETFYYLWVKRFFNMKKRGTIFLCWLFHLPPNHAWHPPQGLVELRKSSVFFRGRNSTHWLFSNPPNPPCTLPVRDVTHVPRSQFLSGIFHFDISEWHILSARAWTPALMLHLTNPCAERKVLSLTKSKGKIYITKSLGHYITVDLWWTLNFCFLFLFINKMLKS